MTQIIADKEKKSSSYRDGRLDALSEDKVVKIKKFAKEYIAKIIRKMEKQNKIHSSLTSTMQDTPSTSTHTPNSHDGDMHKRPASMSVEEAMDMNLDDSGSEDDEDEDMHSGSHPQLFSGPISLPGRSSWRQQDEPMDTDTGDPPYSNSLTVDPRRHLPING